MTIMTRFVSRLGLGTLLAGLLLLTCGPRGPADRPRPDPPQTPSTAQVIERMRMVMAGWAKRLQTMNDKDHVLSSFFDRSAGKLVTIDVDNKCQGRSDSFQLKATRSLHRTWKGTAGVPLPAFLVYAHLPPAEPPPKLRAASPPKPIRCLIYVTMRKQKPVVVAEPVTFTEDDGSITKGRFVTRGGCTQLELNTWLPKAVYDDRNPGLSTGATVYRVVTYGGKQGAREAVSLTQSYDQEGNHAYQLTISGAYSWITVGGRQVLVYRSTITESGGIGRQRSVTKKRITAQWLTRTCEIEDVPDEELPKLRKKPGGEVLPAKANEIPDEGEH